MHISITGDLGSGKSTVGKLLSAQLNYKFISTGQIQRALGKKHGMNTLEFNKYTNENITIDHHIDNHLKEINAGDVPHILDSRLAWFFVPTSFKVYLLCFEKIAATRIIKDKTRVGEPDAKSVIDKINDSNQRRKIENVRFEKNYGAVFSITKNFNLVLDTSFLTVEQVAKTILSNFNKWKIKNKYIKYLLAPKRIFPLQPIEVIASQNAKTVTQNIAENGYDYAFPVNILENKNCFFVYDGHKRLSATLYNNLPIIPCTLTASAKAEITKDLNAETYIKDAFNLTKCKAWEDAHSFQYYKYPEI